LADARASIDQFIEKIYNGKRLHSAPADRVRTHAVDSLRGCRPTIGGNEN
jgi:hypothetical protein